ncbi:Hypothetical predicted protein [Lecanosticta acicola]|uniref:Secreted protein n=1 Tax=Lecanosticta acicola TaxID=111012 RepID=A0AAI8Z2N1_9PEZI|nr:Hypothetical predicted protein [Lecanosticta acicola]
MKLIATSIIAAAAFFGANAAPAEAPPAASSSIVTRIFGPEPTGVHDTKVVKVGQVATVKGDGRSCQEWRAKQRGDGVAVPYCAQWDEHSDHKGNYAIIGAQVLRGTCSIWTTYMMLDYVGAKCDVVLNTAGKYVPLEETPYTNDALEPRVALEAGQSPNADKPAVQNVDVDELETENGKACATWDVFGHGGVYEPQCTQWNITREHPQPYRIVSQQLVSGTCHKWTVRFQRDTVIPWCHGDPRDERITKRGDGSSGYTDGLTDPADLMDNDEEDEHPGDSIFNTYTAHPGTSNIEKLEVKDKVCQKWKVKKLDEAPKPPLWYRYHQHFKPECAKWKKGKGYGHQTYNIATVTMHHGNCADDLWDIRERQHYVEPVCSDWLLEDSYAGSDQMDGYTVPWKRREPGVAYCIGECGFWRAFSLKRCPDQPCYVEKHPIGARAAPGVEAVVEKGSDVVTGREGHLKRSLWPVIDYFVYPWFTQAVTDELGNKRSLSGAPQE